MNNKKSVFLRVLSYISPYKLMLIMSLLCGIVYVISTIIIPIVVGRGLDAMIDLGNVDFNIIMQCSIIILIVLFIGSAFWWCMNFLTSKISYCMVRDLRKKAMDKILNVELSVIDRTSQGDLLTKIITDVDTVSDGLIQGFQQFFTGILTIIATLTFMFILCWPLAIGVLILTPLSMLVASFIAKNSSKIFREQSSLKGELSSVSNEYLTQQKTVILFSYEDKAQEIFKSVNKKLDKVGFKAQFFAALVNPCTRVVNAIIYALVATLGAIVVLKGSEWGLSLTVGTLVSFLTYASNYTKPFNEISGVIAELQNSLASASRIFALLDEEELISNVENATLNDVAGCVSLDDVSFCYVENKPLIENLSLEVNKGQKIALVGPTGCGKTTLINLLMRFYDVQNGSIKIDNDDIRNVTRHSLREAFGMVLQDTWIFKGTIKENIAYAKIDASEEEIISAAKKAHADSFIRRLENGYDTIISEEKGLSQGQQQLLCIARLMLKQPRILILDEATSSIDTRTELLIQEGFNSIMQGKTSFIIAHRLSTIQDADLILVMKDGKVIEQGTHASLLSLNGFYAEIYNSQFKVF